MPSIDRRTMMASAGIASLIAKPSLARSVRKSQIGAIDLRTSSLRQPLEIGDVRPPLSWRVVGPEGTLQSAYHIRVASDESLLAKGTADLWDSGRVASNTSTGVIYEGRTLESRQRCFWQVKIWSDKGAESDWSPSAGWEMGLLTPHAWHGDWLAAESSTERDDRLADPAWVSATTSSDKESGRFRLRFRSGSGDGSLFIHSVGRLGEIALDGNSIAIPAWHPDAYGDPAAIQLPLALADGEHELTVKVNSRASEEGAQAALAALIRVPDGHGSVRRIRNGWQALGREGQWLEAQPWSQQPHFPWPPTPARLFRRQFRLDKKGQSGRLYVAALGSFRIWINGRRIGDDELQTEPAEYRRHIPYRTYDIGELLRPGDNVVGMMVGDGFYASYQAPDGRYAYGPAPRRARLFIEVGNERAVGLRIATDTKWRHRRAHVHMSEIYAGEDQDLRDWPHGWLESGYDDRDWEEAWAAPTPDAELVAPFAAPIRVTHVLAPSGIRRIGPTSHIVDFGQNFAGRVRLKVSGEPGQLVSVKTAEILTGDGMLDRRNLRVARAEDHYVLAGDAPQTLEPAFTYQGFRYAQIDGVAKLHRDSVKGVVISSDLPEIGTLSVSQPLVQKIWLNTLWSQRSNFHGNPTDCPQRDERLGWTGDAQIFWDTAAFNMDVAGFTRSFTRMLRADQAYNGAYPMWSPSPMGLGWGSTTPTPGWADAGVMLPYTAYLHSGDPAIIEDNWDAMEAYLNGILANNPDDIWRNGRGADLGDWLALDAKRPGDETTPKELIATAMLARSLDQVAKMAQWSGRPSEGHRWRELAERTRAAFKRAFVAPDGTVGNGSHTGYILALRLSLVPEALRGASGRLLAASIHKRGKLLTTGFLGTPLALDALVDVGEHILAYDLLLRTEYPSWGYMIQRGATTMWERWNSDVGDVSMNSFNHYAFGAVSSFLYRRVAGIDPIEPGFRRFRVAPIFDPRIDGASVSLSSASGPIRVVWSRRRERIHLDLTSPPNSEAIIVLPGINKLVRSGTHSFSFDASAASNPRAVG